MAVKIKTLTCTIFPIFNIEYFYTLFIGNFGPKTLFPNIKEIIQCFFFVNCENTPSRNLYNMFTNIHIITQNFLKPKYKLERFSNAFFLNMFY